MNFLNSFRYHFLKTTYLNTQNINSSSFYLKKQEYTIGDLSVQFSVFFLFVGRIYVTFCSHDKNINRSPMKWKNYAFSFLSSWVSLCGSGCPDLTVWARLPWSSQRSTGTTGVCHSAWRMKWQKHIFTVFVPDYIVTAGSSVLSPLTGNWLVCFLTSISP